MRREGVEHGVEMADEFGTGVVLRIFGGCGCFFRRWWGRKWEDIVVKCVLGCTCSHRPSNKEATIRRFSRRSCSVCEYYVCQSVTLVVRLISKTRYYASKGTVGLLILSTPRYPSREKGRYEREPLMMMIYGFRVRVEEQIVDMVGDKTCRVIHLPEIWMEQTSLEEKMICLDAHANSMFEYVQHLCDSACSVDGPDDDLCDHRVEVHGNVGPSSDCSFYPHSCPLS